MGTISAGIGLISGINTTNLINELLSLDQKPVTALQSQVTSNNTDIQDLDTFSANLLAVQQDATALKSPSVLNARTASSSNPSILNVTAGSSASLASYELQPVQLAQSQRLISSGFNNTSTTPVGSGTITIKEGGFVNPNTSLSVLNGGQGVSLGQIQITNQAGTKTTVDLSTALSVNDVLNDINNTPNIGVKASVQGGSFVLTDTTGSSSQSISVADVGNATAAEDLGLATGTAGGDKLVGANVVTLSGTMQLSALNDGNGVRTAQGGAADFQVSLADGTNVQVALGKVSTIGDVVNAINSASGAAGKLTASISSDGASLQLTDTSTGAGQMTVTALNGSEAAQDLGILGTEQSGGVLQGGQVLAGLNSVLLGNLNGGSGAGTLGTLDLTDRAGHSATVDLSSASSLSDVVNGINNAGLGIKASINSAGDGIQITDTTGSSNSNLIIADGTGSTLASTLHIATDSATTSVNSGDLNQRYISENTQLSTLNGGSGVPAGEIKVTDSTGTSQIVNLTSAQTIGDVINALNSSGLHILAGINSTGDGIQVTDTGGGTGQLTIADQAGGTTAEALHLNGSGSGQIDGAMTFQVAVGPTDTLSDVVNSINAAGAPFTASIINDGSSLTPYHLELTSNNSGEAGQLLVDTGSTSVNLSTLSNGTDAVLEMSSSAGGSPQLFASSSNTFTQVAPGLTINLTGTSTTPVNVAVSQNNSALTSALQQFVSDYNTASGELSTLTSYDSTTNTAGDLFGDSAMLLASQMLGSIIGQTNGGSGAVQNLADLGVTINGSGQLSLDTNVHTQQLQNNPTEVASFFNTATTGFADSLTSQLNAFTASSSGILAQHVTGIQTQITGEESQITRLNTQIANKKTQLQTQFLAMEQTLASLQSQQTSLGSMTNLFSSDNTNTTSGTTTTAATGSSSLNSNISSIGGSG